MSDKASRLLDESPVGDFSLRIPSSEEVGSYEAGDACGLGSTKWVVS